jgi:hypothetical protein
MLCYILLLQEQIKLDCKTKMSYDAVYLYRGIRMATCELCSIHSICHAV